MSTKTVSTRTESQTKKAFWLAFLVDITLVICFVAIGRKSHHEDIAGTLVTAMPFLGGLIIAWILPWVRKNPLALFPAGVTVWLSTALGGQILRVIFGGSTQLSFIIVTLLVTGLLLLGYRATLWLKRTIRK